MSFSLRTQKTLSEKVEFCGVGVHSGMHSKIVVYPAPENSGFVFKRVDVRDRSNLIPLNSATVQDPIMCTRITNQTGVSVRVIEHLMAAFRIAGITNALIEVNSEEIPIMDGSAALFYRKSKKFIRTQNAKVKSLVIQSEVTVRSETGFITVRPSNTQKVSLTLDYDRINKTIGAYNKVSFTFSNKSKLSAIASARTFGWMDDCEKVRAMGMAKGASLENTVIIGNSGDILNPEGLRNKSEIVYHKALDLIGDLSLFPYDIIGSIEALNTSHLQNTIFLKTVASEINKHRLVFDDEQLGRSLSKESNPLATNYCHLAC